MVAEMVVAVTNGDVECHSAIELTQVVLYIAAVLIGPFLTLKFVWTFADIFNGLMAFPNLVALIMLAPVTWQTTKEFLAKCRERERWVEYE